MDYDEARSNIMARLNDFKESQPKDYDQFKELFDVLYKKTEQNELIIMDPLDKKKVADEMEKKLMRVEPIYNSPQDLFQLTMKPDTLSALKISLNQACLYSVEATKAGMKEFALWKYRELAKLEELMPEIVSSQLSTTRQQMKEVATTYIGKIISTIERKLSSHGKFSNLEL